MTLEVELRTAKIPFIGRIAVHYWFVIRENDITERWEIWQKQKLVSSSWGHLHKNLMNPHNGVGNGDSWCEKIWQQKEAENLIYMIRKTPLIYPYNYRYFYYPGPNSNTYVQWVLDKAEISHDLSPQGLGKKYHKFKILGRG